MAPSLRARPAPTQRYREQLDLDLEELPLDLQRAAPEAAKAARRRRKTLLAQLRDEVKLEEIGGISGELLAAGVAANKHLQIVKLDEETLQREIEGGYIATEDSSEARKKARMLRNRRSAEQSRKRRADKLQTLEGVVADLRAQNATLQKTVAEQKLRLEEYTSLLLRSRGSGKRVPPGFSAPSDVFEDESADFETDVRGQPLGPPTGYSQPCFSYHAGNHNPVVNYSVTEEQDARPGQGPSTAAGAPNDAGPLSPSLAPGCSEDGADVSGLLNWPDCDEIFSSKATPRAERDGSTSDTDVSEATTSMDPDHPPHDLFAWDMDVDDTLAILDCITGIEGSDQGDANAAFPLLA